MSTAGYKPLALGTLVRFFRKGVWHDGTVKWVHLDPNRKPGRGRVSYDVEIHSAFQQLRVAARDVELRGQPERYQGPDAAGDKPCVLTDGISAEDQARYAAAGAEVLNGE